MSRSISRNKSTSGSKENASHPQDHYPLYRAFLMRSLDRCDTELAALVELNRSLHSAKSDVLESCGTSILLDIGQGLLTLAPDSNDTLQGKVPTNGQEYCLDFLLRMKLRTRLLNRLSRRLNRLARAMDGEDIQPPAPPKYGDLRLFVEPNAVKSFQELHERQVRAAKLLEQRRESFLPTLPEEKVEDTDAKPSNGEDKPAEEEGTEPVSEKQTEKEEKGDEQPEETSGEAKPDQDVEMADTGKPTVVEQPPAPAEDGDKPAQEEKAEGGDAEETDVPEETKAPDSKPEEDKADPPAEQVKSNASNDERPPAEKVDAPSERPAEPVKSAPMQETPSEQTLTDEDYIDSLRDYDEAYTKTILPSTGTVKYPILERNAEAEYNLIKYGGGIGATHRTMSSKDKEMEYKRWQTAVLQRIPDQPTFEDLGFKNRVFMLDGRRKRAAEEELEHSPSKKKSKKEVSDSDDSDSSDSEEKDSSDDEDVEMAEAASDSDDDDSEAGNAKKQQKTNDSKDEASVEKVEAAPTKPVKPISLAAVPSFHEQDMKRVRLIHAELMATSIHDHARVRVGEATKEYNRVFQMSNELYSRRSRLQAELNQVSQETRLKVAQLKSEYLLAASAHHKDWVKRHRDHALASLPSAQGVTPKGTPTTTTFSNHPNPILSNVGKAVAEIVDCVVARAETGWKYENPIEEYKPPAQPDYGATVLSTGETLGHRRERLEGGLQKQIMDLNTKLAINEDERKKAWKKLIKVKSEYEAPYGQSSYGGGRSSYGGQYNAMQVPNLRQSGTVALSSSHNYASSSVGSYVPPAAAALPVPSSRPSASESKYSAAKVRERHSADGSVAPASEPKRGKDGLYVRPPGRGRIGMDWDEVRGLWIPLRR